MKREFVINRHGRDYVLYAGLLDEAHQQGLKSIKTQLVQAPAAQNGHVAICTAEVVTERGTFTGIGDADPGNVNRLMANALIRLAETRAKARALRDAVNVAMVAIEELSEGAPEELAPEDGVAPPAAAGPGAAPPPGIVSIASVRPPRAAAEMAASEAPRAAAARGTARNGGAKLAETAPLPATQTQLETIAKLARSAGRTVSTEGLTRAAASELITRLSEERYGTRRGP